MEEQTPAPEPSRARKAARMKRNGSTTPTTSTAGSTDLKIRLPAGAFAFITSSPPPEIVTRFPPGDDMYKCICSNPGPHLTPDFRPIQTPPELNSLHRSPLKSLKIFGGKRRLVVLRVGLKIKDIAGWNGEEDGKEEGEESLGGL